MGAKCRHRPLMTNEIHRILLPALWTTVTLAGTVTVLLFSLPMTPLGSVLHATEARASDVHLFEFTCEFETHTAPGRVEGVMASDRSQQRVAIYWIEPTTLRESPSLLRCGDFIFDMDQVHYWVHGPSKRGTFPLLSAGAAMAFLPGQESVESVIRSALGILTSITCQSEQRDIPLEVAKFFHESRTRARYTYRAPSGETSRDNLSTSPSLDVASLNTLPFSREYSKETQKDGTLVWRARRALNGQSLVCVSVRPVPIIGTIPSSDVFDAATLGQWSLVPEACRTYWSFDSAYSQLSNSPDGYRGSRDLSDRIESYLEHGAPPARVCRAMDRLGFKTSLMTDDVDRIGRSARASVTRLCGDESVGKYDALLESGRIAGQIEKQCPQEAERLVRPLVAQIVKHAGRDAVAILGRLMPAISANNWFMYGSLLLEEIRGQGLGDEGTIRPLALRLEALRLSRVSQPVDPCDETPAVRQYLARLGDRPPKGETDMDGVREILEEGLARRFSENASESKHRLVDSVIRMIRLIAGEGPFRAERDALVKSIDRFSELYLVMDKRPEPIDTVLATFLALSFCDVSTAQDHDLLSSQFHSVCTTLESQVNAMLADRELGTFVTPQDVEGVFRSYERGFRSYVDDPLWPPFKFPLTANEEARLANKLRFRFAQIEPLLDDMSLKFKYGGSSAELKQTIVFEITRAAQQLLPETAFLRKPAYPGVSCQYRGRYGFTVMIKGPLYREGERLREKFMAMKYFHLGHRLEEIVKRERELARLADRPPDGREGLPREQEAVDHGAEGPTHTE